MSSCCNAGGGEDKGSATPDHTGTPATTAGESRLAGEIEPDDNNCDTSGKNDYTNNNDTNNADNTDPMNNDGDGVDGNNNNDDDDSPSVSRSRRHHRDENNNNNNNNNNDRLYSLDLLRGLIVAIMAWDHCKDCFADYMGKDGTSPLKDDGGGGSISDAWQTEHTESFAGAGLEMYHGQFGYFLARAVSHLCAPGFSFLMGVGMVLFKHSRTTGRRSSGWTPRRVWSFFSIRGVVLIMLGFVVRASFLLQMLDSGLPPPNKDHRYVNPVVLDLMSFFQVMTSLGLSMIVAAPFVAYAIVLPPPLPQETEQEEEATTAEISHTNGTNHNATTTTATTSTRNNDVEAVLDANDATTPLLPANDGDENDGTTQHATNTTTTTAATAAAVASNDQQYLRTRNKNKPGMIRIWMGCSLATCTMLGIEQYLVWREQGPHPDTAGMTDATTFWGIVYRFTFIPGEFDAIPSVNAYPFVPWLSITVMGIAFGSTLVFLRHNDAERRRSGGSNTLRSNNAVAIDGANNNNNNVIRQHCRCHLVGLMMLVAFVVVRLCGGRVFSTRGWPLNEGRQQSPAISFLNVCKYPPSVSYILLTMGINLILLDALSRIRQPKKFAITRWLLCFGRVPLAFYILHFYVISLVSVMLDVVLGIPGGKVPMVPHAVFLWLGVLVVMRFVCDRYSSYKAGTSPDSIWRFF